ncbi:MAG: hypothetical protein QW303_07580 [Nitrososphaerota archaeon]
MFLNNFIKMSARFLKELKHWQDNNMPLRKKENIVQIFDICKNCEHFEHKYQDTGHCKICGCRLTSDQEFLNKIAWATTKCPLDPPKWTEETDPDKIEFNSKITFQKIGKSNNTTTENQTQQETPSPQNRGCGCH